MNKEIIPVIKLLSGALSVFILAITILGLAGLGLYLCNHVHGLTERTVLLYYAVAFNMYLLVSNLFKTIKINKLKNKIKEQNKWNEANATIILPE